MQTDGGFCLTSATAEERTTNKVPRLSSSKSNNITETRRNAWVQWLDYWIPITRISSPLDAEDILLTDRTNGQINGQADMAFSISHIWSSKGSVCLHSPACPAYYSASRGYPKCKYKKIKPKTTTAFGTVCYANYWTWRQRIAFGIDGPQPHPNPCEQKAQAFTHTPLRSRICICISSHKNKIRKNKPTGCQGIR